MGVVEANAPPEWASTTAVLVSGGLDSYVAWALAAQPKVAVWVDLGQPYSRAESEAVLAVVHPASCLRTVTVPLLRDEWGNIPTPEKQVVPGRNLILATIAATFGSKVCLSALGDEMQPGQVDKCAAFFETASAALSQAWGASVKVYTPFEGRTKTEVVRRYLREGGKPAGLVQTSTCYDPRWVDERWIGCGDCTACLKRFIALMNNGIEERLARSIVEAAWLRSYLRGWKAHPHYSLTRIDDGVRALQLAGRPDLAEELE